MGRSEGSRRSGAERVEHHPKDPDPVAILLKIIAILLIVINSCSMNSNSYSINSNSYSIDNTKSESEKAAGDNASHVHVSNVLNETVCSSRTTPGTSGSLGPS